jgi:hypothetical protein
MRALRRIATPASVALSITGCMLPVDEFKAPAAKSDAALTTNGDAAHIADDTAVTDACVCVREVSGKCKEWSAPSCAR